MNTFWTALLTQAVKALAGAVVWDAALDAVTALLDARLPGEEKRQRVKAKLREAFETVPSRLLNLVIEVAVLKATPR